MQSAVFLEGIEREPGVGFHHKNGLLEGKHESPAFSRGKNCRCLVGVEFWKNGVVALVVVVGTEVIHAVGETLESVPYLEGGYAAQCRVIFLLEVMGGSGLEFAFLGKSLRVETGGCASEGTDGPELVEIGGCASEETDGFV